MKPLRFAALIALLILGACTQPPIPEDHFYRLTLGGPERTVAGLPRGIIMVERFAADGLTGGRAIVFSDAGQETVAQSYHYHFWMEPPTILLQMALADALRRAGAMQVVTPELRVEPDFVATGRIRAFEQVRGTPGFVRVHLELALTERATGRLVLFRSYNAEPRTANDGIAEAVTEMSGAVETIYSQFLKDIAAR